MGAKPSKKLVPNRPVPKESVTVPKQSGPVPTRMVHKNQVKMVPPDGGWGWMVVLGACLCLITFPAVTVAFGVLFSDRLREMGAGATEFTLIGNGLSTVWSFVALLVAPLSELFGHRRVTILGGVMAFLAMLLSAYSTNLTSFALSYSVIGGMAGTFSTFCGFTIIPLYFSKRKGLANGMVSSASALGKIVMAPLVPVLLDSYGYKWACLLVGALSLHTCVAGMLYHPPQWHMVRAKEDSDCEILDMAEAGTSTSNGGVAVSPSSTTESTDRPRTRSAKDEEDENIIFVMPTPTTPTTATRRDDEIVLFSRSTEKEARHPKMRLDSQLSQESSLTWTGSLPLLTPIDNKIFEDDEAESSSCCDDFIVVKVFRMLNYSLVKDPMFHLVAWPNALCIMGYLNSMYALPGYIRHLNYTPYQSAFAISVFSATEVIFRLFFAALSDYSWFPIEKAYVAGIVLSSASMTALTLIPYYEWILVWVAINGVALSLTSVLLIHLMIKYLGQENYAQVIGFCSILNGIMMIVGGLLIGLSHDLYGSYETVFYMLTVFIGIGAIIWICYSSCLLMRARYSTVSVQAG